MDGKPAAGDGKPAGTEVKATWPENWRETVSKDDAKKLAQLQRYGSPEAALQALFAAQERIRSGELLPKLGKNPSAEELKEWREAHGIPESPKGYDLGKDFKVDDNDKPLIELLAGAAHATNQTPEQLKSTVKALQALRDQALEHQANKDKETKQQAEDALRAEWGTEYRRNTNLIAGLLDGTANAQLKELVMGGRLADGTPIASHPDMQRLLLSLALIQNPTGTVVPGGGGEHGEGIKAELDKLQKIPAAKKSEAQAARERELIDAALKSGFMDNQGRWKK